MKVSENIMNAHLRAGTVPDPHFYPEAALKVLRGHFEVMEHAARFIELCNNENAASEIMTGGNLTKILDFLPRRVRMTDNNLEVAETNATKRMDGSPKPRKLSSCREQSWTKKQKHQLP